MISLLTVLAVTSALSGFADETCVSPVFTFDARLQPSGMMPDSWTSCEENAVSGRFSVATVVRTVDENVNGIPDEWEARYGLSGDDAESSADPDGDGWSNIDEYNAGTNPIVAENYLASIMESQSWLADTSMESVADEGFDMAEAFAISGIFDVDTAGRMPDSDKDGLPDWWEMSYGLDPAAPDAQLDPDGDGRTNIEEYNAGTSPIESNDWTRSAVENAAPFETDTRVWYSGTVPVIGEAFAVVKVSDGFVCDMASPSYDADGDGIPDWWEAKFSRFGSMTGIVGEADDDDDGYSNYKEYVACTDPTNSASRFAVDFGRIEVAPASPDGTQAGYTLKWQSAEGRVYSIFATGDLSDGFGDVPIVELEGTGDLLEYSVDGLWQHMFSRMFFVVAVRLKQEECE